MCVGVCVFSPKATTELLWLGLYGHSLYCVYIHHTFLFLSSQLDTLIFKVTVTCRCPNKIVFFGKVVIYWSSFFSIVMYIAIVDRFKSVLWWFLYVHLVWLIPLSKIVLCIGIHYHEEVYDSVTTTELVRTCSYIQGRSLMYFNRLTLKTLSDRLNTYILTLMWIILNEVYLFKSKLNMGIFRCLEIFYDDDNFEWGLSVHSSSDDLLPTYKVMLQSKDRTKNCIFRFWMCLLSICSPGLCVNA